MKTTPASETSARHTPVMLQRRTMLAGCAATLMAMILVFAGGSGVIVLGGLLTEGLMLLAWLLAAAGYGTVLPLPSREKTESGGLRAVSAVGIGLGLLSLLQLGLGLAGFLDRAVALVVVIVGLVLLGVRCRSATRFDFTAWLNARIDWQWLFVLAMPALAIAIVAAYVPPGVLWGDEPHGYDVLEYHLQLPREWYELGRITPLNHNVFSFFPLGMEMHYLLAMQLAGGPWAGMYLAQLMHVATFALTVAVVYAIARQFAQPLPAVLAAVACANVPWMALLAPVAYNEGALLLFSTLAIGWVMRESTPRAWAVAGTFAGFACGAKLTAVPQVLLFVPIAAAIIACVNRHPARRIASRTAAFLCAGMITFSPWLVRNLVWCGNPIFPEAQSTFGPAHFSPTQSQRWSLAHHPAPDRQTLDARVREARTQLLIDWKFGYVLLPMSLLCAAVAFRQPTGWMIVLLLTTWLIFWLAFTHLQGRFYVLAVPVAAIALALPDRRSALVGIMTGVLAMVVVNVVTLVRAFDARDAQIAVRSMLGFDDFSKFLPDDIAELIGRDDAPFSLVGDARAFLYPVPMSRLGYRTVFDVDVKEGQSIIEAWLDPRDAGRTLVIDPLELDRFARTYKGIPALPRDFPGPRDRAFVMPGR